MKWKTNTLIFPPNLNEMEKEYFNQKEEGVQFKKNKRKYDLNFNIYKFVGK